MAQSESGWLHKDRQVALLSGAIVMQALATTFFVADAVADIVTAKPPAFSLYHAIELLIALALLTGVVAGIWHVRRMLDDARRSARALALAKGALAEIVDMRFRQWNLTHAEQEVALFALKGCDVAEIAEMRQSAHGTVRAQMSRVYAKAGVSGQAMFMSLFLDELLDLAEIANMGVADEAG